MSISAMMQTGLSALQAAQAGLKVASQNIANANTLGYVRTEISYAPLTNLGGGAGVEVASIRRAADKFLATAAYIAEANGGGAAARADLLARAQSYFGDPTNSSSMFASIDQVWASLTDLQVDPSSALARDKAVGALETALAVIGQTGGQLQALISEADERVGDAVSQAQTYLNRISDLNEEIRLTLRAGADPSAVENTQAAVIDQLAQLLDIRVEARSEGGVMVRTSGGALLVGAKAASISYTPNSGAFASHGVIVFNPELGTQSNLEPYIQGGEIAGLIKARDRDLPELAAALGGFAGALADRLNAVHNENSSTPAVDELVGRQTGLLASDRLNFSGQAIIGVVNANGEITQRLTINFGAQTITSEAPPGVTPFGGTSIGAFVSALDGVLGASTPAGNASFTNGVLTLDAPGGGLVVQQHPTAPSDRAGRGFSHFFGLNDLVQRPTPLFFEAGVSGTDVHGLAANGQISFQVKDALGRVAATRTVSITGGLAAGGSTMQNVLDALNVNGTGVGEFATFSLDPNGRVVMTPRSGFQTEITQDSTQRTGTGVSFSALFGLTEKATAGRAVELGVATQVAADPGRLAVGRPNLAAALNARIIEEGDARGAAALAGARDTVHDFPAAGALTAQTTSIGLYASRLGGAAGRVASEAAQQARGAAAVAAAATDRRAQVESVTVDEELLRMTTFQNSYAAAARVIQAANDMFNILFQIGARA